MIFVQVSCENLLIFKTSILYGVVHLPHPTTASMASLEIRKIWKDEICSRALQLDFEQRVKSIYGPTAMK